VPNWLERLGRASWLAIGLVILVAGFVVLLSSLRTIVLPFVLAALAGAVCFPVVDRLVGLGLRRSIAALLVLIAVLVAGVGVFVLVAVQIVGQAAELVQYLQEGLATLQQSALGPRLDPALGSLEASLHENWKDLLGGFVPVVAEGVGALVTLAFAVFIAVNILYYLLADGRRVGHWVGAHIGLPRDLGTAIVRSGVRSLQGYFAGATVVAAFNGVAIGLTAVILGTPLAVVIGLVNLLASYVPYIGAVVGGAIAVLLAIAGGGMSDGLWMLGVLILVNSVFQVIVAQIAFGATLKLHPLVVLLSTTAGGILAGAIGSALGAPFVAVAIDSVRRLGASRILAAEPDDAVPGEEAGMDDLVDIPEGTSLPLT
jgi:predicted PurR-regulated permease PerM